MKIKLDAEILYAPSDTYGELLLNALTYWPTTALKSDIGVAHTQPVLCLPFPTASAAKRRLKWERMSEEQKVEVIAQGLRTIEAPHFAAKVSWKRCIDKSHYRNFARAVLHLLEGERK